MKNIIVIIALVLLAGVTVWLIAGMFGADTNQPTNELTDETNISEQGAALRGALSEQPWIWERTIMNDGAIIEPRNPGDFALTFTTDGEVSGRTDCNGFFGSFTIDNPTDRRISFGPFGMSMMYCEGSQDAEFARMVEQSNSFFFDEEGNLVLLIRYDSGSVVLSRGS
jgi:heat shock protein HslJ